MVSLNDVYKIIVSFMFAFFVCYSLSVYSVVSNFDIDDEKIRYANNTFFIFLLVSILYFYRIYKKTEFEKITDGMLVGGVFIFLFNLLYTSRYWWEFDSPSNG